MRNMRSRLACCKKKQPQPDIPVPAVPAEVDAINQERVLVDRQLYNYPKFAKEFDPAPYTGFSFLDMLKEIYTKHLHPSKHCAKKQLYNRIPAIKWIKSYKLKDSLLADVLAGLTVGIMHIPQGMAYALLATVPPIYGLYTSFFPVLIYWIFGTSKHISIGTFAVISLMVGANLGNLEGTYAPPADFDLAAYQAGNTTTQYDTSKWLSMNREKARIMIAMAHAFWVGVIQCIMFFLQLGFITSYMVEPFLNGFLAGSAVHVGTSQIKFLFGVKLTGYVGIFKIPKTYIEFIGHKIPSIHVPSMIISIICMTILAVVKIHINERFAKKMPVPFPIELVIVVFGTLISYLANLEANFHVNVVGPIPAGIPGPEVPPLWLIKDMILSAFLTAIVAYAINFSLADLFAKKHRYKINTTQELLAYGTTNIFASFFPCFTSGASLARSMVQETAGGRTQLVSVVSCIILGFTLLVIAPLFKVLPQACLASIIVVALKNLILQLTQLPFYWKVNKIEFWLFLTTFLSVVILDVDIGLGIGVVFNILAQVVRSTQPYATTLGHVPGTEMYKDTKLYKNAHQLKNIAIVRIQQELHAINAAKFKKSVYELTGIKPQELINRKKKIEGIKKKLEQKNRPFSIKNYVPGFMKSCFSDEVKDQKQMTDVTAVEQGAQQNGKDETYYTEYEKQEHQNNEAGLAESELPQGNVNLAMDYDDEIHKLESSASESSDEEEMAVEYKKGTLRMPKLPVRYLIIDCSPFNFIDTVGVKAMKQVISDYNEIGIRVFLAECNDEVRDRFKTMERTPFQGVKSKYLDDNIIYVSIHDAVLAAERILHNRSNKPVRL